jgi:O-antigen ligase/polysaccharide polymerase Wzy-like membrane protein
MADSSSFLSSPASSRGLPLSAVLAASAAGVTAALLGDPLGAVIIGFTITAVLVAALRPHLLVVLIAVAVALLPPYVGLLLPGGGYLNLLRGVAYGSAGGLLVRALLLGDRELVRPPGPAPEVGGSRRIGCYLLAAGWVLAPLIGLSHGLSNGARVANVVLYQALPFWVGLRFPREYRGIRVLQIGMAVLLIYTLPFWFYEVTSGTSLFRSYVPPLQGVLSGRSLLLREGNIRAQATFNHALAFDQFLLLATPIAVSLLFVRRLRAIGLVALALGITALAATGSRSPWLALLLTVGALVVIRRPRVALGAAALAVVIGASLPGVRDRLNTAALGREAATLDRAMYSSRTEPELSAAGRLFVALGGVRAVARHPIIGYGVLPGGGSARLPSVDNYYLLLPIQIGLPAAVFIVGGLTWLLVAVARDPRWRLDSGVLWFAAGAYMAELLFVGLYETISLLFLIVGFLLTASAGPGPDAGVAQSGPP